MALKGKKKLCQTATEMFNNKPSKGIAYMQEIKLVEDDPVEIANFMRTNPHLDKKQLGEFISRRDHKHFLKAFVESFDFAGLRVDESLRIFLETFRLPGESPLIESIVEHFSEHWQRSNGDQFANVDAAYVLAYAVIMLNVDQHNKNHTKTNDPMTAEQFKRNLRGTNGGKDHDQDMLEEIYHAIRNEEIVMPAEQTGLVKENYLWKCALKRGLECGNSLSTPKVMFDHDLFSIVWGPAVAALSYVFDKSRMNEGGGDMIEKALHGFQRCAAIAAHYRMSDVLDNIIISLCKFTTLTKATEVPYVFLPQFGANVKALMATKAVFSVAHKHGDILHDGWKNILDCLLWLFKCQVLPKALMEAEDYVDPTGRVKMLQEEVSPVIKVESGFLNSFVSFISMSTGETGSASKPRTSEEEELVSEVEQCIKDCHVETILTDSKFLQTESLKQLIKHLIQASNIEQLRSSHAEAASQQAPEGSEERTSSSPFNSSSSEYSEEGQLDESGALFNLELLVRITLQNKDRVTEIWPEILEHMKKLLEVSLLLQPKKPFLLERSINALLRMSVRLARKEDLSSLVINQSLTLLVDSLDQNNQALFYVARHVAFGLYELLRNNAANIHESEDWSVVFSLLEMVGAGISNAGSKEIGSRERTGSMGSGGWIVLDKIEPSFDVSYSIVLHDSLAFLKCCESLAFLVRDVAHITPHNFSQCVQALRIFVEASFDCRGGSVSNEANKEKKGHELAKSAMKTPANNNRIIPSSTIRKVRSAPHVNAASTPSSNAGSDNESEETGEDLSSEFHHVALQLLDLMHTLHTRAAQIHFAWESDNDNDESGNENNNWGANPKNTSKLWTSAWCPLLQGKYRIVMSFLVPLI